MTADLPATLTVAPAPISADRPALVPVFLGQIGGQPAQVCDGRTLHAFLENGDLFANWVKDRITKYGFQENQDFVLVLGNTKINPGRGGDRRSKDYHFGLDMAKEVSMVENNDRGREARRYFISCERLALASGQPVAITPATPTPAALLPSEQQTLSEIAHARVANQPPAVQGKALAEIWSRLQHKFRIARYDQLPRTELATAILYITALDLRALPRAPAPAPAPPEYLTPNDHRNLQRLIGWISAIGHYPKSLVAGIWYALRQATGVPAPHRFEVQHLPLIAAELQRILEGIFAYQRHRRDLEGELIARIVRGREPAAPFLAQLDREQRAWLDPLRPWQDKLESWHRGDVERLLERAPSRAGLLPGLEEPAAL